MKRSPELRDLSVEHHHGLVVARRLRRAAAGEIPLAPAVERFRTAWTEEIAPHFRIEEEILLPAYARVVAADDPRIARVLTEHVALRRAVADLERAASEEEGRRLAGEIGMALESHIRFEERVLFPAIEAGLAGESLASLGADLARAGTTAGSCRLPDPSIKGGPSASDEPSGLTG